MRHVDISRRVGPQSSPGAIVREAGSMIEVCYIVYSKIEG